MAHLMSPGDVETLLHASWPSHIRQRDAAIQLDFWHRGEQQHVDGYDASRRPIGGAPFMPSGRAATAEYTDIASRAPTPWGNLIVNSLAQTCSLEGVYLPGSKETLNVWKLFQENRWDGRQGAVYRGAFAHGSAYTTVLPATSMWTPGKKTARFNAYSAMRMSAYYAEVEDEFPMFTIDADRREDERGDLLWDVRVLDEEAVHYLTVKGEGIDLKDFSYISAETVHGLGFCPAVEYYNDKDLDGRLTGEISPFIPLFRRLDQDVFDRLVVQRFGAWVVRYGTGLIKPETDEDKRAQAILLSVGEMLISEEANSKFGTLSPTELKGFIEAHDADLRMLAAVSQRPHHHLSGVGSNLPPESMSIVEQSLERRALDRRTNFGESHELLFRAGALIIGETAEAQAFDMQVRWRDIGSDSLSQTADALGKLATQLQIPVELLWGRVPGWSDSDTERAKEMQMLEGVTALLQEISGNGEPVAEPPA